MLPEFINNSLYVDVEFGALKIASIWQVPSRRQRQPEIVNFTIQTKLGFIQSNHTDNFLLMQVPKWL